MPLMMLPWLELEAPGEAVPEQVELQLLLRLDLRLGCGRMTSRAPGGSRRVPFCTLRPSRARTTCMGPAGVGWPQRRCRFHLPACCALPKRDRPCIQGSDMPWVSVDMKTGS